jgi:uncharacterized protein (DUF1778 family)
MTKSRRLSLRVDEATYQILTRGAKAAEMSLSEYLRFLTLKSADVLNASIMDYCTQEMMKQIVGELERLRQYWAEHPERLLQRPPEGDP